MKILLLVTALLCSTACSPSSQESPTHRIQWGYRADGAQWLMIEKQGASGKYSLTLEVKVDQFTGRLKLTREDTDRISDAIKREILRGIRDPGSDTSIVEAPVEFKHGFATVDLNKVKVRGEKVAELFSGNVISKDGAEPRPDWLTAPD